jgi:hypothetical protein
MPTIAWNRRWALELRRFVRQRNSGYYGVQWGDPTLVGWRYWLEKLRRGPRLPGDLSEVVRRHVRPYVGPDVVALEIGSGGGRWTQFLLPCREVVLIELNPEFFPYLCARFPDHAARLRCYRTSGYELDGVADASVDYVLSFGTFVHIEPEGIDEYLRHLERVMRVGATAVLHYADRTKKFFRRATGLDAQAFSDMHPRRMEELAGRYRFDVVEHDVELLNHSSIVVLRRRP